MPCPRMLRATPSGVIVEDLKICRSISQGAAEPTGDPSKHPAFASGGMEHCSKMHSKRMAVGGAPIKS